MNNNINALKGINPGTRAINQINTLQPGLKNKKINLHSSGLKISAFSNDNMFFNTNKTRLQNPGIIQLNIGNNTRINLSHTMSGNRFHTLIKPDNFIKNNNFDSAGAIPSKLEEAGRKSFSRFKNQKGACERTAIELHRLILGKGYISVRNLPKANLGENGQSLDYLTNLTNSGKLKPGMIIFINTVPSMSLKNLKPSNRHWFTYMGIDKTTKQHVFHDQYGDKQPLAKMIKRFKYASAADVGNLRERKIHTIFDPYKEKRNEFLGAGAS